MLFGSKNKTFKTVKNKVSGVEIDGEIRDAVYISQGGIEGIVFGINNKELKFYRFQK
jgi:hypothetical protein